FHRPRTKPRGVLPQLFKRKKAQSAPAMIAIVFGLRRGRWGVVGFSLAAFVSTLIQTIGFYQIAGHTPGERIAFGNSILALASQFSALFPPPIRPDTVGGYVEFRGFHPLAILFAVWALASATGAARGDEERGIVEAALGAGISRLGLIDARTIAFAIGIVDAAVAGGGGVLVGVGWGAESV